MGTMASNVEYVRAAASLTTRFVVKKRMASISFFNTSSKRKRNGDVSSLDTRQMPTCMNLTMRATLSFT